MERAPRGLEERTPRVVDSPQGRFWRSHKGASLGLVGGMGSAGRLYVPGEIHRSDRMAAQGLFDDQSRGIMRPADPKLRLREQELDGVSAEGVYGIPG